MYGVPQGSNQGPLLFTMYIYPLTDAIGHQDFHYHIYADDTHLYCPIPTESIDFTMDTVSECTNDINMLMSVNKLDKTEVILCGTPALPSLNLFLQIL